MSEQIREENKRTVTHDEARQITEEAVERQEAAERAGKVALNGEKGEALKKDIDEIMDEIDGVLEENAEAFVGSYVQSSGQ